MTGRRNHAFTLVEVLVALAILAAAGLVLVSAYVNVLGARAAVLKAGERSEGLRLVREALWAEADRTRAEEWNTLPLPDGEMARWRAEVTPTAVADLYEVRFTVELPRREAGRIETVEERCRLLRPSWSQPADREALRAQARTRLARRTWP